MGTCDVRMDPDLSKVIWSKGSRGALEMRIRLSVKKNTCIMTMNDRPLYTEVTYVKTPEELWQELLAKTAKAQTQLPQRRLHTVSESKLAEYKSSDGA